MARRPCHRSAVEHAAKGRIRTRRKTLQASDVCSLVYRDDPAPRLDVCTFEVFECLYRSLHFTCNAWSRGGKRVQGFKFR
jgi:hypothetical protein